MPNARAASAPAPTFTASDRAAAANTRAANVLRGRSALSSAPLADARRTEAGRH